jgi:hypothetical protein
VWRRYRYIYVNADGTARELHADEKTYLETEFTGGDGNMPYIKRSYEQRDGWGEISGYMERKLLPRSIKVQPAPVEIPNKPMNREESIAWLRAKGVEVIENPDGSYSTKGMPRGRT